MITYDIWLDTGNSYKLVGLRFSAEQITDYVKNCPRDILQYRVISDESGVYPVFTRATEWDKRGNRKGSNFT